MTRGETTPNDRPVRGIEASREPNPGPAAFESVLNAMGREIDRGESRVHQALSGSAAQSYSAVDLIVLQADIYRYTEAVDLAARLVDRAGQAIKTTLQSSSG